MEAEINNTYLYILIESLSKEIKYVGKTRHPINRYDQHCGINGDGNTTSKKSKWIESLCENYPLMVIFDAFIDQKLASQIELRIISFLMQEGYSLVNTKKSKLDVVNFTPSLDKLLKAKDTCLNMAPVDGIIICPWVNRNEVKAAKLYRIQAYVTDETKEAIKKLADEQDRSESYVAGNILNKGVKK